MKRIIAGSSSLPLDVRNFFTVLAMPLNKDAVASIISLTHFKYSNHTINRYLWQTVKTRCTMYVNALEFIILSEYSIRVCTLCYKNNLQGLKNIKILNFWIFISTCTLIMALLRDLVHFGYTQGAVYYIRLKRC